MRTMTNTLFHRGVASRCVIAIVAALGALLCLTAAAYAKEPTGEYVPFSHCPYETAGVKQCVLSQSSGGEVVVGSARTPIKSTLTLQGGSALNLETGQEEFFAAKGAETLSKTPQAVEGGLIDLLPKSDLPEWLWSTYEFFFENGLTGVNATTELAKPASEIGISAGNLAIEEGVALKLPVKVHLENPFLGSECYIGSSSHPIYLSLTTGKTSPPKPNSPISGSVGEITLNGAETILSTTYKLVDNAFSVSGSDGMWGMVGLVGDHADPQLEDRPPLGGRQEHRDPNRQPQTRSRQSCEGKRRIDRTRAVAPATAREIVRALPPTSRRTGGREVRRGAGGEKALPAYQ